MTSVGHSTSNAKRINEHLKTKTKLVNSAKHRWTLQKPAHHTKKRKKKNFTTSLKDDPGGSIRYQRAPDHNIGEDYEYSGFNEINEADHTTKKTSSSKSRMKNMNR